MSHNEKPQLTDRLVVQMGKRRWLQKALRRSFPEAAAIQVISSLQVFVDPRDRDGPSFYLMNGGPAAFYHYEEPEKAMILEYFPGDGVFLDLGANIGLFSVFLARYFRSARFYAFEPHPGLHRCLEQTCRANNLAHIEPIPVAIGDVTGQTEFYFHRTSSGGHSTVADAIEDRNREMIPTRVEISTLDDFVARRDLSRIDFIKIDVQEAERAVFRGARAAIEKFRPAILVECNNREVSRLRDQYFDGIPADYLYRTWEKPGLRPLDEIHRDADLALSRGRLHTNFLLVPSRSSSR